MTVKRTYTYIMHEYDDETEREEKVIINISPSHDSWMGYDGPVAKFFDFLRGCGFVFNHNSELGVSNEKGEFISSYKD